MDTLLNAVSRALPQKVPEVNVGTLLVYQTLDGQQTSKAARFSCVLFHNFCIAPTSHCISQEGPPNTYAVLRIKTDSEF